ncbi:MAG: hypothetical protein ACXQTK_04475, partial [Candidatus Syntropharchaeales archaeon]
MYALAFFRIRSLIIYRRSYEILKVGFMGCTVIVGGFFGDEGKGKIVAHVAESDDPSIIARGGVGP